MLPPHEHLLCLAHVSSFLLSTCCVPLCNHTPCRFDGARGHVHAKCTEPIHATLNGTNRRDRDWQGEVVVARGSAQLRKETRHAYCARARARARGGVGGGGWWLWVWGGGGGGGSLITIATTTSTTATNITTITTITCTAALPRPPLTTATTHQHLTGPACQRASAFGQERGLWRRGWRRRASYAAVAPDGPQIRGRCERRLCRRRFVQESPPPQAGS
jgi:hypothetical protein